MSSNIDIFNRPPDIAGDTVQYTLYPSTELSDKTSATSLAACLLKHAEDLTGENFIWHKDPFELRVVPDTFHKDQWVLEGTMRVGDCVDDEWCMVWLLRQISERWDLAIRYRHSDPCLNTVLTMVIAFSTRMESFFSLKLQRVYPPGYNLPTRKIE